MRLTLLKRDADINVGTVVDNRTACFLNNCINKFLQGGVESRREQTLTHTHTNCTISIVDSLGASESLYRGEKPSYCRIFKGRLSVSVSHCSSCRTVMQLLGACT